MAREKILSATSVVAATTPPSIQENETDGVLRPQRLAEVVGQRSVCERLEIAVNAATKRGDALGHVLLDGPPGLGKTTFATCIPREMGVDVQLTSGPVLKAPRDLVPYLTNAGERSVLFIDEIHRIPRAVEEYLYTAMEDFRIDFVIGEGISARTINMPLKPFTLIGATTRAGMLSGPLRDRFHIREHLEFYGVPDLKEIVLRNAKKLQIPVDDAAAEEIARRARGTPRIANTHLYWIRDYAQSEADGRIDLAVTVAALKMSGVDEIGLDRQDRRYLETLIRSFGGGPAGVEAIAHTMNTSPDTLSDDVEPFLLRSEYITRTPRGRVAGLKAFQHLKLTMPAGFGTGGALFE